MADTSDTFDGFDTSDTPDTSCTRCDGELIFAGEKDFHEGVTGQLLSRRPRRALHEPREGRDVHLRGVRAHRVLRARVRITIRFLLGPRGHGTGTVVPLCAREPVRRRRGGIPAGEPWAKSAAGKSPAVEVRAGHFRDDPATSIPILDRCGGIDVSLDQPDPAEREVLPAEIREGVVVHKGRNDDRLAEVDLVELFLVLRFDEAHQSAHSCLFGGDDERRMRGIGLRSESA